MEWDLDFSRGYMHQSRERGEENYNIQLLHGFFSSRLWPSNSIICITAYCLERQHCDTVTSVFKTHCQRDSASNSALKVKENPPLIH